MRGNLISSIFIKISLITPLFVVWCGSAFASKIEIPAVHTNTPSEDFLHFMEYSSLALKYYAKNPKLCDEVVSATPRKTLACSVLNAQPSPWEINNSSKSLNTRADVLLFGEAHYDQDVKIEFASLLKDLKKQGFTTLGLEMFPSSTQMYLDQFSNNQISLDQIIAVLEQHWFYDSTGYREILKQAKALNMTIIGLDDRVNFKNLDVWFEVTLRDDYMSQILADHLLRTGEKLVVYSGRMHAVKSFGHGKAKGLSEKLIELMKGHNIKIETENILFAQTNKSVIYKDIISTKTDYTDQSVILRNVDYSYIADAMIYVYPKPSELLITMNEPKYSF